MITGIDHIAIAVSDLEKAIVQFTQDLGLKLDGQEAVPSATTVTAFLSQTPCRLELVHPLAQQGPIQKFISQRNGKGGLHHICFSSDNLVEDIKRLKEKGYVFIQDTPSLGAHNTQVVWIHPKSCDGVLIELAQKSATFSASTTAELHKPQ